MNKLTLIVGRECLKGFAPRALFCPGLLTAPNPLAANGGPRFCVAFDPKQRTRSRGSATLRLTLWLLPVLVTLGCSTSRPRVVEVSAKRYDRNVARPGEAFFISWRPATINMVKFEYRQVRAPNKIIEERCTQATRPCATFQIRAAAFASGGPVTAWRVSLWTDDNTCVAEQKSALW